MKQATESLENVDNGDEVGILCNKCGQKMRVYKTCADKSCIQRIRKCDKCVTYKFTTEK